MSRRLTRTISPVTAACRRAIVCAVCLCPLLATTAAAQTVAEYEVFFDATWSAQTHPLEFPANPHFSGLVGGTHGGQVVFWEVGGLASPGIKNMAELGVKSTLEGEVQVAIDAGTAGSILSGGGIALSPGSVSLSFTIDEAYPLVTLVSMLAPSPDWFVGVSGLSLREGGAWVPTKVVNLVVFDAGTDSGASYSSPNSPTVPPEPISEKMDGPFAASNVVGTFTFVRSTVGVPEMAAAERPLLVPLGPNPLAQASRFQIDVPGGLDGRVAVYDVQGRLVRTLLRGPVAAGTRVVSWDGRDDRGVRVAAGVYFLTLEAGAIVRTEKIAVAR